MINSACMHNCACWERSLRVLWRPRCPQCFIAQSLGFTNSVPPPNVVWDVKTEEGLKRKPWKKSNRLVPKLKFHLRQHTGIWIVNKSKSYVFFFQINMASHNRKSSPQWATFCRECKAYVGKGMPRYDMYIAVYTLSSLQHNIERSCYTPQSSVDHRWVCWNQAEQHLKHFTVH